MVTLQAAERMRMLPVIGWYPSLFRSEKVPHTARELLVSPARPASTTVLTNRWSWSTNRS